MPPTMTVVAMTAAATATGPEAVAAEDKTNEQQEKKMNVIHFRRAIIASALIAATSAVQAVPPRPGHHNDGESLVRARVVASEPVYQTINEPQTECWNETVGYERRHSEGSGGTVLGAIAGGLIGSTVGKGNGRVAAAAVGAATGAVIGDRMDRRDSGYSEVPRQVERCQTTDHPRRVLSGYDVRYRYQGREYSTQLPYNPGPFIKLRVSIAVAEDQRQDPREDLRQDQRDDDRRDDRDDR